MPCLKLLFIMYVKLMTLQRVTLEGQCGVSGGLSSEQYYKPKCEFNNYHAKCVGDGIADKLPTLGPHIYNVHARCFNFTSLTPDTLANVHANVTSIYLGKNNIQTIPSGVFTRFQNLRAVTVSDNSQSNISQLFTSLANLQNTSSLNITLRNMQLSTANISTYINRLGHLKLKHLSLKENIIETLDVGIFSSLRYLQILKLSRNWISRINGSTDIHSLQNLDLSENRLSLSGLQFCKSNRSTAESMFPNLKTLSLKRNVIGNKGHNFSHIWSCLEKLETLDLSNNTISEVNISKFTPLSSLKTLLLRTNWIQSLTPGKFPPRLETIDFRQNEFLAFLPALCEDNTNDSFPNLKTLNFSRNYIQKIFIDKWDCLTNITTLDFSKNDVRIFRNHTFDNFTSLKNLYLDNMVGRPKIEIAALSSISLQYLSLRFNWINFSQENMQQLFTYCPNVKALDISYNYFSNLNEEDITRILSPMKNLEVLWAQRISLQKFPTSFLEAFPNLKHLDINRNLLSTIQFPEQFNNEVLNLSLAVLSVAEGDINFITKESFPKSIVKSLKQINLGDNEFACRCDMKWFKDHIHDGHIFNIELKNWPDKYECRSPSSLKGTNFRDFKPDSDCPLDPVLVGFVAAASSVFVVLVLSITAWWNRWYLQYMWYKIKHTRASRAHDIERRPLLGTLKYDGYVVYNENDDSFVHHSFLEFFENRLDYKLHIWKRDAANGAIVDVILNAMYESRHVIVVVSNNLLKDPWGKFQVDVAIDRSIEHGRNFVLLVVLEEVDFRYVSKAWCVLLTKTPSAKWSSIEDDQDFQRRLFEQTVKLQLSTPMRKRHTSVRINGDCNENH